MLNFRFCRIVSMVNFSLFRFFIFLIFIVMEIVILGCYVVIVISIVVCFEWLNNLVIVEFFNYMIEKGLCGVFRVFRGLGIY